MRERKVRHGVTTCKRSATKRTAQGGQFKEDSSGMMVRKVAVPRRDMIVNC
jgi:hypothetical protein